MPEAELPEWYTPMSNSSGSCPWFGNMRHWGHTDTCPRQLVADILSTAGYQVITDEWEDEDV